MSMLNGRYIKNSWPDDYSYQAVIYNTEEGLKLNKEVTLSDTGESAET